MMANRYLAQQRAPIMAELDSKPWLTNWLSAIGEKELGGNHLPILESLVNRAEMTGKSLEQLTSRRMGFYQTVNKGDVSRMVNAGVPQNVLDNTKAALDQIRQGSNVTQGATDQGMWSSIKSPWKVQVGKEWFGDMGDNPVSLARSSRFRTNQQAAASQAGDTEVGQATTGTPAPAGPASPGIGATLSRIADVVPGPQAEGAPDAERPLAIYERTGPFPLPANASLADRMALQNYGLGWAVGGMPPPGVPLDRVPQGYMPLPVTPDTNALPPGMQRYSDARSDVPGGFTVPNVQPVAPPRAPMSFADQVRAFGLGTQEGRDVVGIPSGGAPTGSVAPPINYDWQKASPTPPAPPINVFPQPPQSQDAINAAIADYLRAQQQQSPQSFDSSDASYAGAY